MSFAMGATLGPYEISGTLGAGGMGEAYRARDTRIGRDVAIKVLPANVAAGARRPRPTGAGRRACSHGSWMPAGTPRAAGEG